MNTRGLLLLWFLVLVGAAVFYTCLILWPAATLAVFAAIGIVIALRI